MGGACVVNKRLEKVGLGKDTKKIESVRKNPGKDESEPGQGQQECEAGQGRRGKDGF